VVENSKKVTVVYINLRQQWNKVSYYCMLSSKVQYYFLDLQFCNFFLVILPTWGTFALNFMFFSWEEGLIYLALKYLSEFIRINH